MLDEVARNAFNTERDLLAYQGVLGTEFTAFLYNLGPESHWVDAGVGRARAVAEYLESDLFPAKARVTGVALHPPAGLDVAALEDRFAARGLRYLHGRPIEELSVETIGAADLITDVYGPLQYSRQIDQLLEHYGRLLRSGGRLWAALPALTAVREGQRELPLVLWLARLGGFRALRLPEAGAPGNEIVLLRTGDPLRVPRLGLSRIDSGPPPIREYRLLDT